MPTVLLGLAALVIVVWALQAIAKANPGKLVRVMKPTGGIAAVGAAVFLGMRGQLAVALPLGFFGLSLLGWLPFGPAGFGARTQKTTGQVSRVRTSFVEMELDHDTGAMRGRFVAGPHEGVMLDTLDVVALTRFCRKSMRRAAPYSQRILTAGSPPGVRTRRAMRHRGGALRAGAK